ncbi:hypothetical protein [Natronoarchaeum rubrum]|uniref:hypothetical protein n=1 Tax=Natronoarchaeum rubrum TaxID=755311 RepID=UPI002112D878|nr:hypothetical protein [Natronoarchaeum rubrum]
MNRISRRRSLLRATSGLAITALSGCLLFGISGSSSRFDLSINVAGTELRTAFSLDQSELSPEQMGIIDALRENGTTVGYDQPRFEDGEILHLDGSYHRIVVADTGSETIRRPVLKVEMIDESKISEDPVPLSKYDESAYKVVHEPVLAAQRVEEVTRQIFYTEATQPEQLQPKPQYKYVKYQDEVYRLEVTEQDIEADQIEYTWADLPTDETSIEEAIRDQYEILDVATMDLSADARSILEEAINTPPYEGTSPFSNAEEELLEALNTKQQDVGTDTRWIVFQERFYQARINWSHSD